MVRSGICHKEHSSRQRKAMDCFGKPMRFLGFWVVVFAMASQHCVTGPTPRETKQAEIEYDLGVSELRVGRVTEALKYFLNAISLQADFSKAHNGLGLVYHMLGQDDKALEYFDRAIKLKPDYSEVYANIARVHISQGKFRKAIPLLKKALEDVFLPERYLAESNLGWALFRVGDEREGFRYVRNALAQNDQYCVGYEYLGLMHQQKKEYTQAVREFKNLVKLCPNYLMGYQLLGKVTLMEGDRETGCAALQECLKASRMTPVGQECERLFQLSCSKPKLHP